MRYFGDCWATGLMAIEADLPSAAACEDLMRSFPWFECMVKPNWFAAYMRNEETIEDALWRNYVSYLGKVKLPRGTLGVMHRGVVEMGKHLDLTFDPHEDGNGSSGGYHQDMRGHGTPFYFPFESEAAEDVHVRLAADVCRVVYCKRWTLSNEPYYAPGVHDGGWCDRAAYGRYVRKMVPALRAVRPGLEITAAAQDGYGDHWVGQVEGVIGGVHVVFPDDVSGPSAAVASFHVAIEAVRQRYGRQLRITLDEALPVGRKPGGVGTDEGAAITSAVLRYCFDHNIGVSLLSVGGLEPVCDPSWRVCSNLIGLEKDGGVVVTPGAREVQQVAFDYGFGPKPDPDDPIDEPEDEVKAEDFAELAGLVRKLAKELIPADRHKYADELREIRDAAKELSDKYKKD